MKHFEPDYRHIVNAARLKAISIWLRLSEPGAVNDAMDYNNAAKIDQQQAMKKQRILGQIISFCQRNEGEK